MCAAFTKKMRPWNTCWPVAEHTEAAQHLPLSSLTRDGSPYNLVLMRKVSFADSMLAALCVLLGLTEGSTPPARYGLRKGVTRPGRC